MPAKSRKPRPTGDRLAASMKRLVNKVMGINFKAPDAKAGRELLRLVDRAEQDGDKRLYMALESDLKQIALLLRKAGAKSSEWD